MHAAARQFNTTTPKMVAKWVERPHNCATFWPRLHRCQRAAAWPSADAGSRTPAHISSSVAFEEASLLMPVYELEDDLRRDHLERVQERLQGRHHCTTFCRLSGHSFHHQILVAKERLADSRPDAPQQCEKCTLRSGEALAAPAELCVINGTLPL
ncbi:hypothetical protein [Bradyrhizobium sp. 172]|uniref:hypothetical protein n=1 Tax=Bradyrhizobium sp. 172 TaxID=2782643 RepID=UPI001FFE33F2|nr:hypothetical protein [Bradyrhizobium sp. 172]UPJ95103.1 hypothetical protein IVB07_33080 [Bradyrhizobium sp. 172]